MFALLSAFLVKSVKLQRSRNILKLDPPKFLPLVINFPALSFWSFAAVRCNGCLLF